MRKNPKNSIHDDEHGIISIVQKPSIGQIKTESKKESESDKEDNHGIISIVQAPDEAKSEKA